MNEYSIHRMKILDRYGGVPLLFGIEALRRLLQVDRSPPEEIRRILLIKLWGLGNLVMIIPQVRALRLRFPRAEIHFLTLACNLDLLRSLPELDAVHTLSTGGMARTALALLRAAREIRRSRYDLVLDFEQFLKATAILTALSGAPQTIGFRTEGQARAAAFNVKVPYNRDRHMSQAFADIVRSAGVRVPADRSLAVPRTEEGRAEAEAYLGTLPFPRRGPLAALHLGSGDNFPGRRWPVERFAALARRLALELDATCLLTGSERERPLAARCIREAGVPLHDAMGRVGILGFIELLARVDLLVTNDTAPVHIGSALGVPLVALFGPNTPEIYGPSSRHSRVFYNPLPCSPCLTNLNAKTSRCRIPSCILAVDPDEVFEACRGLLEVREAAGERSREGEVP